MLLYICYFVIIIFNDKGEGLLHRFFFYMLFSSPVLLSDWSLIEPHTPDDVKVIVMCEIELFLILIEFFELRILNLIFCHASAAKH